MLFCVDVGNTNVVAAVYRDAEMVASFRLATDRRKTADDYAATFLALFRQRGVEPGAVTAAAICSGVPPLDRAFEAFVKGVFGVQPLFVRASTFDRLRVDYQPRSAVGADRLMNALAGAHKYGTPLIVVDLGTATTFDVIGADGTYLGGAIAPGVEVAAEALYERAAALPRIDLVAPAGPIGKSTAESLRSGLVYGTAGQVDALVRRIRVELGANARVIATGGLAWLIAPHTDTVELVDEFLTLEGLRLVHAGRPQQA